MNNTELEPMAATATETTTDVSSPAALDVNADTPGTLLKLENSDQTFANSEWQEQLEKALQFLVVFPDHFGSVFGEYRKPMTTVGLILAAGLGIAVADGVLARLNAIPLFAPTFELVGLGFTGWVVVRYLLYADTRNELLQELDRVKARILGKAS
ncbi:CAAD domain-containing protein [Altericista sp. CCNU0014]|uniref:CAAD domain-containing protein n=1 Tax=Altericista sp. CCNU0014 TaxID=3082949 RepID=UPI00384FCDE8